MEIHVAKLLPSISAIRHINPEYFDQRDLNSEVHKR
jgi:hypothetical protein